MGHTMGVNAVVIVSSSAYAQVARQLPRAPVLLVRPPAAAPARAMRGSRIARTAVPMRPVASAPVTAGRKAYTTAAQARSSRDSTREREAKYAVKPARGTDATRSTVTASPAEPNSREASMATIARYGGAASAPPAPTGCQPSR